MPSENIQNDYIDGRNEVNADSYKNYVETKIGEIIDEYSLDNLNKLIEEVKIRNKDTVPLYFEKIKKKIEEEKEENPNLEEEIREKYRMDIDNFILILGDSKLFKNAFLKGNYRISNFKPNGRGNR